MIFIAGVTFGLTLSNLMHSRWNTGGIPGSLDTVNSAARPLTEPPGQSVLHGTGACMADFRKTRKESNGLKPQHDSVSRFVMHDPSAVEAFCDLLEQYRPGRASVLEWGCGGSTVFYSRYAQHWQCVEHDDKWGGILSKDISANEAEYPNVDVSVVPIHHARHRKEEGNYTEFASYIEKPHELGRKYDVVLIDGRARIECAIPLIRKSLLNPGARVVIHDWQRYEHELQPSGALSGFELAFEDRTAKRWMGFLRLRV